MWNPRETVFGERRQFNQFGASDDWRSIVQRRLVALQYMLNDQGDVVDTSGNVIVAADDTSGTGQTPAELAALGYSPDDIANVAGSLQSNVFASGSPTGSVPTGGAPTNSSSSSGWLSGVTAIFGTAAQTATNISRGLSNPSINPATGLRYGVNPATGLPYPAATSQAQSSLLVLVVIVVIVWFVFKG